MIDALSVFILLFIAIPSAIGGAVLLIQVLAARRSAPTRGSTLHSPSLALPFADPVAPLVVVLIPAHNEELGLGDTLRSVLPQLGEHDRVLVVADNCTDSTEAVAAQLGVEVVRRSDPLLRGKGYALDFGARHLESWARPPDVVVVLDADCRLGEGALACLASSVRLSGRTNQALYLMQADPASPLKVRLSEFAWIVKNHVRPRGMMLMNWPCALMGSGMAFPWSTFRHAPLATGDLVEDMKLGTDLALLGAPPLFCEQAVVRSRFPSQAQGLRSQRQRWEAGHLSIIRRFGCRLLYGGLARGSIPVVAMAIDLCVPPLALLVVLQTAALVGSSVWLLFSWGGHAWWPFVFAAFGILSLSLAISLAWVGWARHLVSGSELLAVPAYVLQKLPIYLAVMSGRRSEWVRTRRDGE